MKYDFSGYATKNGLKCSDGRTIIKDAFKINDGQTVPLVWQHLHNEPENVLGHALLKNIPDGVYCYGVFNETEAGKTAKELVKHEDVKALSIYANNLKQKGQDVIHGTICEVSLVLSGANPGALIDNLSFAHSDGTYTEDNTEAVIYTGLPIEGVKEIIEHASATTEEKTIKAVFDSLNEDQKTLLYAMVAQALSKDADDTTEDVTHINKGGTIMKKNLFETAKKTEGPATLNHSQIQTIINEAKKCGSLKEAVLAHAANNGIENIEILFPDATAVRTTPDLIKRDTGWVAGVMGETHHTPFSRIKSMSADLTEPEVRAKGYIKGSMKKEDVFSAMKRITTPTTVYKKMKLDRDDITDITDFDVVVWLKKEMRGLLNEELARAILIGDRRAVDDPDRINPTNIRPIWLDEPFYSVKVQVPAAITTLDVIDEIIRARKEFKGTGIPSFYTTTDVLTDMLLVRDTLGRRIYPTVAELASVLRVDKIVEVEVMEGATRIAGTQGYDLLGILVNLKDYTIGADKGGQVAMFDDFDIDYNQYKYLIETRCSGALTRYQSAVVIEKLSGI